MSSIERLRSAYENLDLAERAMLEELDGKARGQKASVWRQHRMNTLVAEMTQSVAEIESLRSGKDSDMLNQDVEGIKGAANAFEGFYAEVNNMTEYHRKFESTTKQGQTRRGKAYDEIDVAFSGEEVFGKYFDLHELYQLFRNIPDEYFRKDDLDYLHFVGIVGALESIPIAQKTHRVYQTFVEALCEYLLDFCARVQPLEEVNLEGRWDDFLALWDAGAMPGWMDPADRGAVGAEVEDVDPNDMALKKAADLEAAGADALKVALDKRGLKCGGTLSDRANRLWSVRGLEPSEYPKKLLAKGMRKGMGPSLCEGAAVLGGGNTSGELTTGSSSQKMTGRKAVSWAEYRVKYLLEGPLDGILADTAKHVLKQQTRTPEEKARELKEEEAGLLDALTGKGDDEDDDENDTSLASYNPSKLYLGWDGKPIPYWMYRLHGLSVSYPCEICAGAVYRGRLAYDKHFQEPKHAGAMRALGLPNTKHFHDVTKVADALALYEKLKLTLETSKFKGEVEEEYEDNDGNVFNRRTYEDLARQGLL